METESIVFQNQIHMLKITKHIFETSTCISIVECMLRLKMECTFPLTLTEHLAEMFTERDKLTNQLIYSFY